MNKRFDELENVDRRALQGIFATLASNSPDSRQWFRDLVGDSDLPETFKQVARDAYRGAPSSIAGGLIDYAFVRGVQPGRPQYTALGAILKTAIETSDISVESAQSVAALIVKYQMYRDASLLKRLRERYGLPVPIGPEQGNDLQGPWLGPELSGDDTELQGFFQPRAEFLDVGFLTRGVKCVGAVCRIEIPEGNALGTGFLVGTDEVLTNFHVMEMHEPDTIQENVKKAVFRFRNVSAPDGQEAEGQVFRTMDSSPVLASSPSEQLDFVLIKLDPSIASRPDIGKVSLLAEVPCERMPLNILQHPKGGPMSLAISKDGIRNVFRDRGLVQYVTPAAGGSSGSPCFNDDWKVVAIHHAARARSFGSIREGILMSKVYPVIEHFLK